MECRFCKLDNIELLDDGYTYRCPYCGYSFQVSRATKYYDIIMQMPLSSLLFASMLWFAAILTGITFGLGFNSSSLSTTILFMYLYGVSALIYGFSVSLDYFQAIWLYIKEFLKTRRKPNFEDIKAKVQKLRKQKIIKEMATGRAYDEVKGEFIETDIRPGEKKVPKIAPSFLGGLWTILTAGAFSILYNVIFPPLT